MPRFGPRPAHMPQGRMSNESANCQLTVTV
jgi:hypothetical protein